MIIVIGAMLFDSVLCVVMPCVFVFGVLGIIVITLGMVMPDVLAFGVLCVVVIALGVIMAGMVVSGVLRIIVIIFGMVMSSVFIVGMLCMVFFDMLLMISISVFIVPVFIMCRMTLIGWRCGR
ncbi:MAG: hypothetical protein R3E46_10230 [Sedimenticolaceae bacterium]